MSDWVPFHRRLAKGPKKGLPRAVRFVLLELSLESRATRGVIDLPPTWDTVDAVHDLIGGNKREIAVALKAFTSESLDEDNAISIEKSVGVHRIVVKKWTEWAGPKSCAERVADHRERKRALATEETLQPVTPVTPTGQEKTGEDITRQEKRADRPPPAAPTAPAPNEDAILAEMGRHSELASIVSRPLARAVAEEFATRQIPLGLKLEWLFQSIRDCAGDAAGLGLNREALTKKLRAYCKQTKKPREDVAAKDTRQAREQADHDGPVRMPKPTPKEPTGPPASVERMIAASEMIAKIGKGAA
ncbi:MAG: hypothetical protein V4529_16515 [Gemmatimonadota bacterium]